MNHEKYKKVVHLTSAHLRDDIRIFRKMCSSLTQQFYVSIIVADGGGDDCINNVTILDVGKTDGGRLSRMTKTVHKVYQKALELNADLYHLHDPELIFIGLKLKKHGYKVIFDAHEDLPKQLKSKPYLGSVSRKVLPYFFEKLERFSFKKFDALIGATPTITNKLAKINSESVNINNFPILGELNVNALWEDKHNEVCYLGGITEIRGIKEVIKSLGFNPQVKLNLAGKFAEKSVKDEVETWSEWQQVNELGFIDRKRAAEVLSKSKVGLVTFHPYPNHVDAQPNKMFEYMSAGLPIVTSDFPMWKEVVEGNHCGICVDPLDPNAIGNAVGYLLDNPLEAEKMGSNGLNAVINKYNWEVEEKKLLKLYSGILS